MGKLGWIAGTIGIVGVIASWFTPQKSIARKRRKIQKLGAELEELFESHCDDRTRNRIRGLQSTLAELHADLEAEAH